MSAALAAANVTVTVNPGDRDLGGGGASKNFTMASLAFGDGALTYPANGVPLPAIGAFGFHKAIHMGIVVSDPDKGFVYKYDKTNHSIRIYTQGAVTGATAAASNENGALALNSAAAEGAVRLPHTAPSTIYDLGPMIELPATVAPAATSLQMLLIGE
ncbi:MAG TPA: hypothetical protein DCG53_12885 [Syntrophus sp. (in: bacteria)]|jgi:hypothetical protein|nr:hypothetical protein [Syntrophus sp. (in: bacteria)]